MNRCCSAPPGIAAEQGQAAQMTMGNGKTRKSVGEHTKSLIMIGSVRPPKTSDVVLQRGVRRLRLPTLATHRGGIRRRS
jgi:hypothetical protein